MDAKYRRGCQVAETAAAPLSTGTGLVQPEGVTWVARGWRRVKKGSKVASLIEGGRGGCMTLLVTS